MAERLTQTQFGESVVGERANPHPSQRKDYTVEIIDQAGGEVCVRYVKDRGVDPWWITERAWTAWKANTNANIR